MDLGTPMVKWITLDPCTQLSESDSKQYNDFEICERKIITFKKTQ